MGPLPYVVFLLIQSPPQTAVPNDPPITGIERLDWAVKSTIGPASLLTGVLTATWGTLWDHPREYGESFEGFAKRYGLRLTGVATSNVMEASLGTIWGEDPRYFREEGQGFGGRLGHVFKMTVMAEDRGGKLTPAYARYSAIAGSNVLSDAWRPDGDRGPKNTVVRIGEGFGGRLLGNMWDEFWPSVKTHLFLNKR